MNGEEPTLTYEAMFRRATGFATPPFDYQRRLAEDPWPAGWRASREEQAGVARVASERNNDSDGLPASDRGVAKASGGGADPPPMGPDPAQRGREHGLRGRAGKLRTVGSGTRSASATRYFEARPGSLSCGELARHLAENALAVEHAIGPQPIVAE